MTTVSSGVPVTSFGIVPVYRTAAGWEFLLLRVYKYWDFPKGLPNPGEFPEQTALRELREETGIESANLEMPGQYFQTEPYSGGKVARYYLAEVETRDVVLPVNPELGKPEHHQYRWVAYSEGSQLVGDRVGEVLQWAFRTLNLRALEH